jgi:hypothetical protein
MATPSFIRTGTDAQDLLSGGPSVFLQLKAGKAYRAIMLHGVDGIVSFNQHAIWQEDGNSPIFPCYNVPYCPGEIIGDKPRFRAMANVLVLNSETKEVEEKILAMGASLFKQLVTIEDTIGGSIRGQEIMFKRTGETRTNTKYSAIVTGRTPYASVKGGLPKPTIDMMEHIGPMTPEEAVEMLIKAGVWTTKHQFKYEELSGKSKAGKFAMPELVEEEVEDESFSVADDEESDDDNWTVPAAPVSEAPVAPKGKSSAKAKESTKSKTPAATDIFEDAE